MLGNVKSEKRLHVNPRFILVVLVIVLTPAFTPIASVGQPLPGDDILNFRIIQGIYDPRSFWQYNYRMEVYYTCNPSHGRVIVGAYFAPTGNGLMSGHSYWGDSPVVENRMGYLIQGTQKVNVAVHLEPGAPERTTTILRIFLYEPNRQPFFTRDYPFTRAWRR